MEAQMICRWTQRMKLRETDIIEDLLAPQPQINPSTRRN